MIRHASERRVDRAGVFCQVGVFGGFGFVLFMCLM